jgi:predicted transcriptional regulator
MIETYPNLKTFRENKFRPYTSLDIKILRLLDEKESLTRPDLVRITNKARTTIYDSLQRLLLYGDIQYFFETREERGRPKTFYSKAGD